MNLKTIIALLALTISPISAETITFSWTDPNPVGASTGYKLYQAALSAGPWSCIATNTTTTATMTNAPVVATWFYVTCYNDRGESVPSNIYNLKALIQAAQGFKATITIP